MKWGYRDDLFIGEQKLNYIITTHAKQRRSHHPIRSDDELKTIMERFNGFYNFHTLEDGKYLFRDKGRSAVFKKDGGRITLITSRGVDLSTEFDLNALPELKLEDPEIALCKAKRKFARQIKNKWMQYYPAVFEETNDGGYNVFFPDVSGCNISTGVNLEEAIIMAKKAIAMHLSNMLAHGDPFPKIDLCRSKEVAKGNILVMVRPEKSLLIVSEG